LRITSQHAKAGYHLAVIAAGVQLCATHHEYR